jgi:hypothetical protein
MAILALVQGAFGLLRAFGWVQIGVDLFEHGLLLMPMLGAVAMFRGSVIGMVAILYLLFAVGAMIGFTWSWAVGLTAALINVFLALIVLIEGVALGELLPWVIIPTILVVYLFSPPGRKAFDF